jgi:hypothetical protein
MWKRFLRKRELRLWPMRHGPPQISYNPSDTSVESENPSQAFLNVNKSEILQVNTFNTFKHKILVGPDPSG